MEELESKWNLFEWWWRVKGNRWKGKRDENGGIYEEGCSRCSVSSVCFGESERANLAVGHSLGAIYIF